jgi:TP901 family phage tail tape measure protein
MNAYGLSAQSVNDILTAQFELVKRGVLVYSDISTSMGKVYASAKNIGVGYKELYTLVGFLSKMGLSVDRSTTALNTLFSKLADKTTINNFQKIGIQMFDINGKFRNFSDILEDLNTLTAGLNENVRSSILSALHIPLR